MNYIIVIPGGIHKGIGSVLLVAMIMLFAGCGSLKGLSNFESACEQPAAFDGAANLSLFLNINHRNSTTNLSLKISSVEILVDELWIPLFSEPININSADAILTQKFIGRQWIRGRYCRGVKIKVAGATIVRSANEQALPLVNHEVEIMLQNPISLDVDSRKVMLIDWEPEKSVLDSGFSGLGMTAYEGGAARITANLAYVACPDLDTVYIVRTDKYQVVGAFAVKGSPTYLTVDATNKKIYVLASMLNKIIPYDVYTLLPTNEFLIPMANSPIFMTVNNRTQTAFVLDAQGVITSIDLLSGNMLMRNRVGNGPNYLYYIEGLDKLAVSSSIDQSVYLLNPDSLVVEDFVSLGSAPGGLVSLGNNLYIAESSVNAVSVYDLGARKILKKIHVGFEPTRFVTHDGSVYVTNYLDGSISIIQGEQLSVSKEMDVGKNAREMAVSEKQRLILVGAGDCNGFLAVVDTTGNHVIGQVELGAKTLGMTVID
jgi:DNA-binding beta-propeller fold protein YncE